MRISSAMYMGIVYVLLHSLCGLLEAQQTRGFEDLTLEISTALEEVLPMEPMPISITLSNRTASAIRGHTQIDPGIGLTKIYAAKGDGSFAEFKSSDWPLLTAIGVEEVINPGFRKSVSGYLFYAHPDPMGKRKRGQYLFEAPGVRQIKATLVDFAGEATIESNVLTIRVKEPIGPDAPAYEFLRSIGQARTANLPYGDFLLTTFGRSMTSESQRVREEKEEFISRFPDSQYAKYVYYSLGDDYRLGVGKGVERGIDYLKKAASYERFFLAYQAMTKLIDTLAEQNRTQEAEDYKKLLASRYPNSGRGRDYREEAYEEGHRETHGPSWLVVGVTVVGVLAVAFAAVYLFMRRGRQGQRFP